MNKLLIVVDKDGQTTKVIVNGFVLAGVTGVTRVEVPGQPNATVIGLNPDEIKVLMDDDPEVEQAMALARTRQ